MQTIKNPWAFKLVCYVDRDKRTYNPGLIISNPAVQRELNLIKYELRKSGRNVDVMFSDQFSNIESVPDGSEYATWFPAYKYDPYLIW
jgi:hypothetical protein